MKRAPVVLAALLALFVAACDGTGRKPPVYQDMTAPAARLNAAAARDMINAYRRTEGLPPVVLDSTLTAVAETEARAVAARTMASGRVSPTPDFDKRLAAAGYPATSVSQNVSAGYFTIAEAFSGWRESPQHRATMLKADATDMGIAAYYAPRAKYKVYWVLVMAGRTQPQSQ